MPAMEKLIVDAEGKVIIPPAVIHKRGLRPGDELALVEVAEGLLVYQGGTDPETAAWWQSLNDAERRQAAVEARRYEALSEAERDTIWNANAESIARDAEGDERGLPAT
jgi:bifunctional DNA-binding transcriptional regulator/antitoxin component of YhaV-PrlF toxin-antitoxin module